MDTDGTIAPSQVVINGVEYSPEDAQQFIELGKKTREYEQKWNTSLDKVWPEYGRLTQERTQWQTEKQKYEQQLSDFQAKQRQGVETPSDVVQAREAAKKLGIVLDEDLKSGNYVRRDDLDKWYEERRTKEQEQERAVKVILEQADQLSKEIDGSDGRPKFNKKSVLAYASQYGISDLKQAYEDMFSDEVKAWKDAQVAANQKPGLKTLKQTSGKKEPEHVKVDNDNVNELLKETLWGNKDAS